MPKPISPNGPGFAKVSLFMNQTLLPAKKICFFILSGKAFPTRCANPCELFSDLPDPFRVSVVSCQASGNGKSVRGIAKGVPVSFFKKKKGLASFL
jgi:hypothetical protein